MVKARIQPPPSGPLERIARGYERIEQVKRRWARTPRPRRVVIVAQAVDLAIDKFRGRHRGA